MPNEPDDSRYTKDHGRRPWGGLPASGDAAALEMERHLRSLRYTGRLAQAARSEAAT